MAGAKPGKVDYFETARSTGKKDVYEGRYEVTKIGDDDVTSIIEQWIELRYAWGDLDPEAIARAIAPISTDDLKTKIRDLLAREKSHSPPEQHLAEAVSGIQITLGEHNAEASFDLILRVNGIPLVVPTHLALQVVPGRSTHWNPFGLYINGVVEQTIK